MIYIQGEPLEPARDHLKKIENLSTILAEKVDTQNIDELLKEEAFNRTKFISMAAICAIAGIAIGVIIMAIITKF